MVRDWQQLAERLGPQSAAYMYGDEWQGILRTVPCECGALIEIMDEGEAVPAGEYLCAACTLRQAFTGSTEPVGCAFPYIRGGQ